MDHNPWSAYNQHYSRLGGGPPPLPPGANPQTPNDLSLTGRAPQEAGGYVGGSSGAGGGPPTAPGGSGGPMFLSTHHGLNATQNATHPDASFNTMNLLSPNFESPLLSSSFQHSAKSHFTGLPPSSTHPSGFFKTESKDELADLRGGFGHRSNSAEGSPMSGGSSLFEAHNSAGAGNAWRAPPMPPTSCGPFGILPHQAVMQNGDKQQQRGYPSGILPSPSRPPSSFVDHTGATAALGSQGESQYFNDGYYPCTKTAAGASAASSFTPFNSSLSPSISSPSSVSQQNFYADKDKSASMEPFSPNLHGHNGQSSSSTSSVSSSRPGVISTPGCQNSPGGHGFNHIGAYPYPSPSSQHSVSPSVVQSPQDSRGIAFGSNQASPSVHHSSPYPSMNTPAPASTPAQATPPSSIGQAYCPNMIENSPRVTSAPSCSSANYSSVNSPKDGDPLQLNNAHYMSPSGMQHDMMSLVGKSMMDSELSAIDSMVEKHRPMEMDGMYSSGGPGGMMMSEYEMGMKGMDHQADSSGLHPAIADFQTIPTTRKRGRGRPRGSVNKRCRRARRSRRGSTYNCESERYIPDERSSSGGVPMMTDPDNAALRNTYSSRLHISRAPHNRVFTSRKDAMQQQQQSMYGMLEPKQESLPPPQQQQQQHHQMSAGAHDGGPPSYMSLPHYDPQADYNQGNSQGNMGIDDSKVFNFEEQATTNEFTSFAKFMSEARGETSTHHISQHSHSHSANSTRAMMMGNCMTDPGKMPPSHQHQQHHHYLGVKEEMDDLLSSPSGSTSGLHHQQQPQQHHHHQQDMKSKNYMSIEDDLGFLAELPPIEPEPIASDPNGNKAGTAKDPGGFLQSFLSFIEGSTEPSSAPPEGGPTTTTQPSLMLDCTASRGRRGAVRGRRGRGARGRTSGRRRGMLGVNRHALDQRQYDWSAGEQEQHMMQQQHEYHHQLPHLDFNNYDGGDHPQKDTVVPNPEAPSFSSEDEDNTSGGIADSVAFVIRRLSEDEPPPAPTVVKSGDKQQNGGDNANSVKYLNGSQIKREYMRAIIGRGKPMRINGHNFAVHTRKKKKTKCGERRGDGYEKQACAKRKISNSYLGNGDEKSGKNGLSDSKMDSYEFEEGVTSPRRTNSMRRCKVETMKKREEKMKKKSQPSENKSDNTAAPVEANSSGEDAAEESDTDPAWTPGSKPPDASKTSLNTKQHDPNGKRKGHHRRFSLPSKLSFRFSAPNPLNGENGISVQSVPGVIHLLKEGKIYTRVKEHQNGGSNNQDQDGGNNKFDENNVDDDSGNSSDSSTGSSFKDETVGTRTEQDDVVHGFFRTGDFVISKSEVEICGAPLWQIEGKSLLQRFDTFEKDGRVLYRNASTYSAWNPSLKTKYLGVTVRVLYSSRAYTIVEYLGLSSTDIPEMSGPDEPLDGHPQRENFEVFLQTLISQVLDPNFITEIVKEQDDYFLSHLKVIDEVAAEKKLSLSDPSWDYQLKECAELYPCLNVALWKDNEETCQLCQKGAVQHSVEFHGQLYDQTTLSNQTMTFNPSRRMNYPLCEECTQAVVLFHRLQHHKYNFFLKCHSKVAREKSENLIKESHVILEHCLQDTIWVNEMFSEMQEMWMTCEKPR